mmetsp:Transcript_12650/g.34554  ORF Transcript_12650/g.34554 Transcript_12650/m.34554 type:complete len:82 (+) Transcript_12650:439-684(+)
MKHMAGLQSSASMLQVHCNKIDYLINLFLLKPFIAVLYQQIHLHSACWTGIDDAKDLKLCQLERLHQCDEFFDGRFLSNTS